MNYMSVGIWFVVFKVFPAHDNQPILTHRNSKTVQRHLAGAYLEDQNEDFMCHMRNILPRKGSTSFMLYYIGKLRLESANGPGGVVKGDQGDGTKFAEWKFTTLCKRSGNGGKFWYSVNWKTKQYSESGLKSKVTENIKQICKYSRTPQNLYCSNTTTSIVKNSCKMHLLQTDM